MTLRRTTIVAFLLIASAMQTPAGAQDAAPLTESEATDLGIEAYIFGYPLVTMELTRRVMTNVAAPDGMRVPMGQFKNAREYPDAAFRDVTAPNADTLYSFAWIDLASEPYVLGIPDEHDRYFLMPMLSGWTDVFQVPGTRTTGTKAQHYLVAGPGWKGSAPRGVEVYHSPTNLVWVLGRTYCSGTAEDYTAVHAIQDHYSLVPLSSYGKSYTPPPGKVDPRIDMKTPVRDQVNRLTAAQYFGLLASLMMGNPPAAEDARVVARMAKLGIVPGQKFEFARLDSAAAKALEAAPRQAQARIMAHMKQSGTLENGWTFPVKTGVYGTDYLQRALVAAIGLGANRPQDAIYPVSEVDADGKRYSGANKYVMHFAKGQTPPVKAFWSLTMYDAAYFFVANPLNRYSISPRNDLKPNADGSIDLLIQHESPGKDKESNWLPAPQGKFILMLRMYWPSESSPSIINGTWKVPAVTHAN